MSKLFTVALFSLLIVVMAVATVLQRFYGAAFAVDTVYSSPWFAALWGVAAFFALWYALKRLRGVVLLFHVAFFVILAGALVTYLWGEQGSVRVHCDALPSTTFTLRGGELRKMPFALSLDSFSVEYYDGSAQPKDYFARLVATGRDGSVVRGVASANVVFKHRGYRFYQSGYDGDLRGCTLLVSHDPWGVSLTYLGYGLLFVGFLLLLGNGRGGFRTLLERLKIDKNLFGGVAVHRFVRLGAFALFAFFTYKGICRWVDTGVFPAVNGSEAMALLAWCALLVGVLLGRRFSVVLYSALAVAALAFALFVFGGGFSSSPAVPVLRTPLLTLHVVSVILAYALFFCIALNGAYALFPGRGYAARMDYLAAVGRALLYPAMFFLVVGIFIGAVWANVSWGRYWGWDPKEVWALITMLVYSFLFHRSSFPFLERSRVFHIYALVAFLAVLFTFVGVNFLLGGLHSYAHNVGL